MIDDENEIMMDEIMKALKRMKIGDGVFSYRNRQEVSSELQRGGGGTRRVWFKRKANDYNRKRYVAVVWPFGKEEWMEADKTKKNRAGACDEKVDKENPMRTMLTIWF
ncbi:hypothetical protein EVAR_5713_1 [Eumeta japonica]|uniref:Uncharacterized protein n=1 Tax=Eumeta variegata TaxID=151549 RepID=A0A4C1T8A6_EUMVA|nr:hypothetical protein EVAR_5713_1 [Eumeta japonica]